MRNFVSWLRDVASKQHKSKLILTPIIIHNIYVCINDSYVQANVLPP